LEVENSEDYMNSLNRSLSMSSTGTTVLAYLLRTSTIANTHLLSTNGNLPTGQYIQLKPSVCRLPLERVWRVCSFAHIDDAAIEFKELYLPDLLR